MSNRNRPAASRAAREPSTSLAPSAPEGVPVATPGLEDFDDAPAMDAAGDGDESAGALAHLDPYVERILGFAAELVLKGRSVDDAFAVALAFEAHDNDASTSRQVVEFARTLVLAGRPIASAFEVSRAFEARAEALHLAAPAR